MAVPEGYTALGTVGIAYKGEYSGGTTYKYLNCVYHNGSTYVALKEVTGIEPTDDGENWKYLAQGVVGAAAGFGDITATVDDTSGTPAVAVETGEDNTAMDITFKFTGLKGADGEDGTPGTNGDPGADGKTWKPSVAEDGTLTWTQDDSAEPPAEANIKGKDGTNGTDGTPGAPGKDGTSVTKVEVRDGHLYVTLDEAEPQDVGEILPAEPKHKKLTTTLVKENWQGEAFPFTYQISLPDVTAQQSVIVAIPEKLTEAEIEAFSKACITPYAQEAGSITLQAVEKPAIDLKIIIEIGGELEEVSFIMLDVTADAGSTVSATEVEGKKETVQGGTVGEEGVLSFNLPRIGRWTVLGVLAGQSAVQVVTIKEHIHYPITLKYFTATITVTTVAGAQVTATSSDKVNMAKATAEGGTAVITIRKAGIYTLSATFDGGKSEEKTVEVTEDGAAKTETLSFATITVTTEEADCTVKVSKDAHTFTKAYESTPLKFYLPETGEWSVELIKSEATVSTQTVNVTEYTDYPVTMSAGKKLADCTWDEIAQAAENHTAKNLFKIGDEKKFTLTGEYAQELTLQIAGFDYDDKTDGSGKAGITFITKEVMKDDKIMKDKSDITTWSTTTMYNETLPAIFGCFPEEVKTHVKEVDKSNPAQGILGEALPDIMPHHLFLLSWDECFYETKKYPIFTDDASRIKKKMESEKASNWWLREATDANEFYGGVMSDGTYNSMFFFNTLNGVVFAFCI